MPRFSANLGFLWSELSLPDAIDAAKRAGFDAVECHWPYAVDARDVNLALQQTRLEMISLNTSRGDVEKGENGLLALVDQEQNPKAAIDEALEYAVDIGCKNVHAMAGVAQGDEAHEMFVSNLTYACDKALAHGITILIEPLNTHDAPDYFLSKTEQAKAILSQVGMDNFKLLFDCYHVQIMEGKVIARLQDLQSLVGHIQFASVPDRNTPDLGELDFHAVFKAIDDMGYHSPLGAEYKPLGNTNDTLSWMKLFSRM